MATPIYDETNYFLTLYDIVHLFLYSFLGRAVARAPIIDFFCPCVLKNKDNTKNEDDLKMKAASKMKMTSKMKTT